MPIMAPSAPIKRTSGTRIRWLTLTDGSGRSSPGRNPFLNKSFLSLSSDPPDARPLRPWVAARPVSGHDP